MPERLTPEDLQEQVLREVREYSERLWEQPHPEDPLSVLVHRLGRQLRERVFSLAASLDFFILKYPSRREDLRGLQYMLNRMSVDCVWWDFLLRHAFERDTGVICCYHHIYRGHVSGCLNGVVMGGQACCPKCPDLEEAHQIVEVCDESRNSRPVD